MPSYDERTPSGWPLPFKSNTLEFDVERLRESFLAVDEALQALRENFRELLDDKYYGLEERQYILDARMDVIAGQTTDDSEILDARVDAKGVTHPNLGHNVRELHNAVIDLTHAVEQDIQDLGAVLKQLDDLAQADIQGSLNAQAAHQQIHECIDAEFLTREESDEALQRQAQALSAASIQQSLSLQHEAQQRRKANESQNTGLLHESLSRSKHDDFLQSQINDLAFAVIQVALNDRNARERFRQSIDDFYQVMADSGNMTYMGAKVATSSEVSDMLSDVLSGSDSGAVSISEIPEELRNRVATSSEISEILAEIFNNNN